MWMSKKKATCSVLCLRHFAAFLYQNNQFTSADYVDVKPFNGPVRKMLRWAGVNWVVHSRVPGVGTANEHLFVYHRNSIGHAVNSGDMDVKARL